MEAPINGQKNWILVVDDDASNLKIASYILTRENMRVSCLQSGLESPCRL